MTTKFYGGNTNKRCEDGTRWNLGKLSANLLKFGVYPQRYHDTLTRLSGCDVGEEIECQAWCAQSPASGV